MPHSWERLDIHIQGSSVSPDRITPASSMLELVKALSMERRKRVDKGIAGRTNTAASPSATQEHDVKELRSQLVDLVAPVDPDDPQMVARVRRPLLQAIVLWEFGSDFRQDPEFGPMLDTLERTFEADPRMPSRLAALVRDLRR